MATAKSNQQEKDQSADVLKWILGQTYRAKARKNLLDRRLKMINLERESPIGGRGYDPLPHSSGTSSNGAASITMKLADIEEKIYHQKEEIDKAIVTVMDIMDYLPDGSLERDICEMRHIDLMRWQDIQEAIPMCRSQCYKRYNKAIALLLQNGRIRKIVTIRQHTMSTHVRGCWPKEEKISRSVEESKQIKEETKRDYDICYYSIMAVKR